MPYYIGHWRTQQLVYRYTSLRVFENMGYKRYLYNLLSKIVDAKMIYDINKWACYCIQKCSHAFKYNLAPNCWNGNGYRKMWMFLCVIDLANLGGEGIKYEELISLRNVDAFLVCVSERWCKKEEVGIMGTTHLSNLKSCIYWSILQLSMLYGWMCLSCNKDEHGKRDDA